MIENKSVKMTGRGKGGRPSYRGGKGPRSKTPANNGSRKSLNFETVAPGNQTHDLPARSEDKQRVNSVDSAPQVSLNERKTPSDPSTGQTEGIGSRFKPLDKTCKFCDIICVDAPGLISDIIICQSCNRWSHMGCEKLDREILTNMKKKGTFICDSCQDIDANSSDVDPNSSEIESSMNSEDRRRAEYDDSEMDEDALLRETDDESLHVAKSNVDNKVQNSALGKESTFVQKNEMLQVQNSIVVNREMAHAHKMDEINSEMAHVLKSMATDNSTPSNPKPALKSTGDWEKAHPSKQHAQIGKDMPMDTDIQNSIDPNQVNQNKGGQNQMDFKMDQILNMVQGVRENLHNVELKVTQQDQRNQQFMRDANTLLMQNVQNSVKDYFDQQKQRDKEESDKKIKVAVAEEMQNSIGLKIDSIFTQRTGPTIDYVVNQRLSQIENRLDDMVDQKIDYELDEFQERQWRARNILIVNLPESKNPNVEERKNFDFDEICNLFNLLLKFDHRDIEGLPVRLGRIGDKPRTLRVTLRSEYLASELTKRARESNHLLNPTETDNHKKLYLNRDYTDRERRERKSLQEEKKDRESRGEKVVIRKRKVVPVDQDSRRNYPNTQGHRQNNRYENRPRTFSDSATRGRIDYRQKESTSRNYAHAVRNSVDQGPHRQGYANENRYPQSQGRQINGSGSKTDNQNYGQANRGAFDQDRQNFQGQSYETGRSPLNRSNQDTILRDEQGPYIRDDDGRDIRGAEAGNIRDRQNGQHDRRSDPKYRRYDTEGRSDDYRDIDDQNSHYRSGRPVRESSRHYNRNQLGSRPYGGAYSRK